MEATIVEIQEFKKWQKQNEEEFIKQQQRQRERLNNEENRIYHALNLSVEELNLSDKSLNKLIGQEKKVISDLIDFDTPDQQCKPLESQRSDTFLKHIVLRNENNNNNNNKSIIEPRAQLNTKNSKLHLESNLEYDNSYNEHSCNSLLSINSMESSRISDRHRISIDEIPVPSPKKDFHTLLEERLRDTEFINVKNNNKPLVKKPFLKKGQGLARYMLNSNSNKTKKTGRPRSASVSSCTQLNSNKSKTTKLERCNSLPRSKPTDTSKKVFSNSTSLSKPRSVTKNLPLPKKKIPNKPTTSLLNSIVEKKNSAELISDTNSSDLEIKNKCELDEVRIFELLEDKAENSSFCSTSSTVIAFLQQSTPLKNKALLHSALKHKISLDNGKDETLEKTMLSSNVSDSKQSIFHENMKNQKHLHWDEVPVPKMKADKTITGTILPYGTDMDEHYEDYITNNQEISDVSEDENSVSLHVRFSEHNEYKTMTDASSISSDSDTIIDYVDNKGAWSDCSATPDSSDAESIPSTHSKTDNECNGNKEPKSLHFIKSIQSDNDENEIENKIEIEEENEDEMTSEDVTLQNDTRLTDNETENISLFKSELLKTRLLELEQEIEIFRKESAALTFQRQKLHDERTKLHEEHLSIRRAFKEKEETLEMERRKTENILQEEKKRLAREKAALENRMKDAWEKAQKSKQERQEIQALKDQIEELQEDYSQKESKWSATNARQRSQIRVLQTENSKLKQELEKINQKKNAKLKKTTISSNTRTINQINKFLADRKKVSPLKNDDAFYEDELKLQANINCEVGSQIIEEKEQEKEIEKVKILKTAESIARTRNLYESLLKDATEDLTEINIGKRNLIDQYGNSKRQTEDCSNEKENNYNYETVKDDNPTSSANSISPQKGKQLNKYDDDQNNKIEHHKFVENKQGIREVKHPDGHVEYWYPNGNVKKVFPDKLLTKMIYYNGDVRETDKNGTVKYFYAGSRTWHTTMPDGLEILEFPDGQVERRSINGTIEVAFPDGSVKIVQTDGSEKWALRDGTIAETSADGEKVLILPNGQREVHNKDHKRREYPDGTIKLIYPDGVQETRYANGRIRLKDKDGNLIMDSQS